MEKISTLLGIIKTVTGCEQGKECHVYASMCFRAAREAGDASDSQREALFALLGRVTSLNLKADSATTPFSPMPSEPMESEPLTPLLVISNEDINLLAATLPSIEDV